MNITWDEAARCFIAELTAGEQRSADQQAAKAAGFRASPPAWRWSTPKVEPLLKLRKKRPASGLTITDKAFEVFTELNQIYEKNLETRRELAKAKRQHCDWLPPGKEFLSVEDLPPMKPLENAFVPPPPPEERCSNCDDPVYPYEYIGVFPMCLWCSKILDN